MEYKAKYVVVHKNDFDTLIVDTVFCALLTRWRAKINFHYGNGGWKWEFQSHFLRTSMFVMWDSDYKMGLEIKTCILHENNT